MAKGRNMRRRLGVPNTDRSWHRVGPADDQEKSSQKVAPSWRKVLFSCGPSDAMAVPY